jgi:HAD superfamily hydrolase (TIGR01509 family)
MNTAPTPAATRETAAPDTVHAVIFDMDGLLLDTERLSRRAWLAGGADMGVTLPLDVLTTIIGRRRPEVEAEFVRALGEQFEVDTLYARHAHHYRMQLRASTADTLRKPGAIALLDWLSARGVPVAVATSTLADGAREKLTLAGLHDRLPIVVTGEQVPRSKPAPDIFLEAARRLGVPPDACLAFEDSDLGLEAALAAGMRAVAVPDLKPLPITLTPRLTAMLTSLQEALALCETLCRPTATTVAQPT